MLRAGRGASAYGRALDPGCARLALQSTNGEPSAGCEALVVGDRAAWTRHGAAPIGE
jgi:hypothetical protein